jgi:hypothetical protein
MARKAIATATVIAVALLGWQRDRMRGRTVTGETWAAPGRCEPANMWMTRV